MKTLRQQTHVELDDLNLAFVDAALEVWNTRGIDAFRCYALGA